MASASFFDADYYENGIATGKSGWQNYRWMPRRSFKEALAFADYFPLDESCSVLDFGCAKGFLVRALRALQIPADGCDISTYALSFAPAGCWNSAEPSAWSNRRYTHSICKDVLEHLEPEAQLPEILRRLQGLAPRLMCVIPMGDGGRYRIPAYHNDPSHLIAEDEQWWQRRFAASGWNVIRSTPHVPGLKDNWAYAPTGNHVFVLEAQCPES